MVPPYNKLSDEQRKLLYENVKIHQDVVKAWLFKTHDVSDDVAIDSLKWLTQFIKYSNR